ncbi:transcription antitermination factor NusB [bacterium]|nr:transcription antitermination factor NusB [bacterium]MBU3955169.1 transcription antitermination factor NusB [bacterium]
MTRRQARKRVLDCLYEVELGKSADEFLEQYSDDKHYGFIKKFVETVSENTQFCDDIISRYSKNWELGRITKVDKLILRMGISEIKKMDIDKRIVINEAVELAKVYSTEKSPAFINGILNRAANDEEKTGGDGK